MNNSKRQWKCHLNCNLNVQSCIPKLGRQWKLLVSSSVSMKHLAFFCETSTLTSSLILSKRLRFEIIFEDSFYLMILSDHFHSIKSVVFFANAWHSWKTEITSWDFPGEVSHQIVQVTKQLIVVFLYFFFNCFLFCCFNLHDTVKLINSYSFFSLWPFLLFFGYLLMFISFFLSALSFWKNWSRRGSLAEQKRKISAPSLL